MAEAMARRAGANDEIVLFDRGDVRAEVIVRDGKTMTYEQVCDEARSLLLFEAQQGGFHRTRPEVKR